MNNENNASGVKQNHVDGNRCETHNIHSVQYAPQLSQGFDDCRQ